MTKVIHWLEVDISDYSSDINARILKLEKVGKALWTFNIYGDEAKPTQTFGWFHLSSKDEFSFRWWSPSGQVSSIAVNKNELGGIISYSAPAE